MSSDDRPTYVRFGELRLTLRQLEILVAVVAHERLFRTWPRVGRVARFFALSFAHVNSRVERLEDFGLLRRVRRSPKQTELVPTIRGVDLVEGFVVAHEESA